MTVDGRMIGRAEAVAVTGILPHSGSRRARKTQRLVTINRSPDFCLLSGASCPPLRRGWEVRAKQDVADARPQQRWPGGMKMSFIDVAIPAIIGLVALVRPQIMFYGSRATPDEKK